MGSWQAKETGRVTGAEHKHNALAIMIPETKAWLQGGQGGFDNRWSKQGSHSNPLKQREACKMLPETGSIEPFVVRVTGGHSPILEKQV